MPFITTKHKGLIFDSNSDANFTGNGIHCYGGVKYFQANFPTGANGALETYDIGQSIGIYSSNDAGTQYTELAIDQNNLTIIASNATLSNVTVWGSDSILTQGRGDGRYLFNNSTTANVSYSLTGQDSVIGLVSTYMGSTFYAGKSSFQKSIVSSQQKISNITYISSVEFDPTPTFGGTRIVYNDTVVFLNHDGLSAYTGTANYAWSSDHFITQGRADGRYVTPSCLTYSNITGTPDLSIYLTTANAASTYATISSLSSYLPSANFTYANIGGTIPTATTTTLGAIKVGSNLTISNGTLSASIPAAGFTNGDTLNGGSY